MSSNIIDTKIIKYKTFSSLKDLNEYQSFSKIISLTDQIFEICEKCEPNNINELNRVINDFISNIPKGETHSFHYIIDILLQFFFVRPKRLSLFPIVFDSIFKQYKEYKYLILCFIKQNYIYNNESIDNSELIEEYSDDDDIYNTIDYQNYYVTFSQFIQVLSKNT